MVTFIIASAHLPKVGDAVAAVLAQDAAHLIERVLVLGPDLFEQVPAHPLITHLPDVAPGPAGPAYNLGLSMARSEFVVLMDADCVLNPDWLTRVQARHAEGWDVVAGGVDVPPGSYLAVAYNYTTFYGDLSRGPAGPRNFLTTMNLSLRRSVAAAIGPVREDIPRWYDTEWTLRMRRAGYRLFFDPSARVRHYPCYVSPAILWRTWFASGSVGQMIRRDYADLLPGGWWMDHPWLLLALAPLAATAVTARVLRSDPGSPRLWSVLPVVWMTKLAWCLGASHGRRRGHLRSAGYRYQVLERQ